MYAHFLTPTGFISCSYRFHFDVLKKIAVSSITPYYCTKLPVIKVLALAKGE